MNRTTPEFAPAALFADWLARRGRRASVLAGLAAGALAGLGQAPFGAWPLSLIAFSVLYGLFLSAPHYRRAALIGWAGGAGYFLTSLHWIVEPFLVDIARHGWMAPFALVFMAGGLALFWAAGFAAARIAGQSGARNAAGFVSALVLAEALRGWIFTGFPWAQPGHIWVGTPLMPLAAYFGALGLCVATLLLAVLIWKALCGNKLMLATVLILQAALLLAPQPLGPAPIDGQSPVIRLVQPNAPQHQKWKPAMMPVFFNRQVEMTRLRPAPDLVVWPETAIPSLLNHADEVLDVISSAAGDVPVVLGAMRLDGVRLYNSLALLDGSGTVQAIYDKHHLVPFGEYLPFGNVLKRFGLRGLAAEDGNGYSAGPGPQLLDLGLLGRALPLICYEGVFPRDVAGVDERPDFILLITNDAWFGQFSGPYQHLAQARLRSVEQGLPMVRVANTGVSAMIDARGALTAALPLGRAGHLDVALPGALPPTLYSRIGDTPLLLLALLILGGTIITRRKRPEHND